MNILKTLRKPYTSIFLSFLILFISCQEYYDKELNPQTIKLSLLTEEQIEEIGLLHNQFLTDAINSIELEKINKGNIELSVKDAILGLNIDGIDKESKEFLYQKGITLNLEEAKANLSPVVKSYMNKIENAISTVNDYSAIVESFDKIKFQAKSELQGTELQQVLVMISVGKHSAEFWLPEEFGGIGIGNNFMSKTSANKCAKYEIIVNDIMGALEGAIGWALAMAILGGPVSLTAYLISIGYGAATASIGAAYSNCK